MKDALILEHKKYISARRASELTGYTSDYVGQLCRSGKIESRIVGRGWFVLEESLLKHKEINDQVKTNKKTAKNRKKIEASIKAEEEKRIKNEEIYSEDKLLISSRAESLLPKIQKPVRENIQINSGTNFRYEKEESPFMPLLKKVHEELQAKKEGKRIPINFVPSNFSVRKLNYVGHAVVAEPQHLSRRFTTALVLILLLGGIFITTQSSFKSFSKNSVDQSASISSVSNDIITSISRGLKITSSKLASLLGIKNDSLAIEETKNTQNSSAQLSQEEDFKWNGIAVAPSTNSLEKDEIMKQRIKDSFSDEVVVRPDQSKTSGVITPVFKKATSDDFVYVLVPVQERIQ